MAEHVHVSALSFLIVALYIIVFGIIWRVISLHMADNPFGKAMSTIF